MQAAIGHSLGEWTVNTAAACVVPGETERACSLCSHKETQSVAATGHDWEYDHGATPATCENEGSGRRTCNDCNEEEDHSTYPALGHAMPALWTVSTNPDCLTDGEEKKDCLRDDCEHNITQAVAALGHSFDWLITTPVGIAVDGVEAYTCIRCPETTGQTRTIPMTGTPGLAYTLINGGAAYSVSAGTAGSAMEIVIPPTHNGKPVTAIEEEGFLSASMTSVTIPNSVTSIDKVAFYGCTSLTSVTIPNSVTSIGDGAFAGFTGHTTITVDPNNPNYSSQNGVLYNKTKTTLISAPGAISGSFTIPNSVTSIGLGAFYYCTSLTSVTIPNGVTSIGDGAFEGCTSLTSVTIPNGVTSIGYRTFYGCTSLASISIPNSVTSIGWDAFRDTAIWNNTPSNSVVYAGNWAVGYKGSLSSAISLTAGTRGIATFAFDDCTSLTSVTIPNSVTSIGWGAFWGCTSLASISIPNSVTSIGTYVFRRCTSLTSVTISNSVTSIGEGVFSYCGSLTSVTIPNSVTSIGEGAFYYCVSLTSVTFQGTITSANFDSADSFPGDLRAKYLAGGIGTYKRTDSTWTKQ